MDIEKFEEVIRKIHNYTSLICLHVKGEPLLHKQLKDILKILEKYNLKANITTNGTLIKDNLEIIKNSKSVRQINFSIHNIFESVEQIKNTIISYRLWNLKNIEENSVNKNIIKEIEDYYNIKNLQHQLVENNFIKIKDNMFINQDIEFTWPNINQKKIIERGRCLAIKEQLAILVDGTVVPCCLDNNGDIPLGNILEETMDDILKKDLTINIKKNFKNSVITCELFKTCRFLKNLENKRKLK